jgi:phenylpropionate dioxygenase-like ring-hydroxylating dioxygenase large terminal subunit
MFSNFWYPLAKSDTVADKPHHVRILSHDFVVFRGALGTAHCLANICVRRGGSLAHRTVKGDCVDLHRKLTRVLH